MSKLEDIVENFHNRRDTFYKSEKLVRVSSNGEISYDTITKEYVVFEETYAYEVGRTCYPKVATTMLKTYAKEYLE